MLQLKLKELILSFDLKQNIKPNHRYGVQRSKEPGLGFWSYYNSSSRLKKSFKHNITDCMGTSNVFQVNKLSTVQIDQSTGCLWKCYLIYIVKLNILRLSQSVLPHDFCSLKLIKYILDIILMKILLLVWFIYHTL